MKKRVLSLLLTLCMLLGLLPAPVLAAGEAEPDGETAQAAMAPAPAEVPSVRLLTTRTAARAAGVSPTITLGAAKHYQGDDLPDKIASDQWQSGAGNYTVTADGLTLRAAETAKGTTASYVLQPFTIKVEVPARTAYTVAFKFSGIIDRGSDGSSIWFSELENSFAEGKALSTKPDVVLEEGAVMRAYGNSRNYRYSPAGFAYITFDNTKGAVEKTVTQDCAWLLGAAKPKSVSADYLHQMDATLTLTVDQGESKAVKAITYDPARGGGVGDYGHHVTSDSPVTLFDAITRTGYEFKGWKDTDGTTYAAKGTYIKDVGTVLTAQWDAKKCTVTFNANGGSVSTTSQEVTYGQPYGTMPTPTREGYDFYCWGTTAGGGYKIEDTTTVYLTENHTLYAIWQSQTKKILLDSNGGDYNFLLTATGKLSTIGGAVPERTGYTFDGWYTEKTGGTKVDADTSTTAVGDTLYAHWKADQYTVTLDANGGSVSPSSVQATYDSAYPSLPTPTKAGYQFDGWYTAASGGELVQNSVTKVTRAEDHTLYAHWVKPYWTITFNANGGYPAATTRRVDQSAALGELPVVARTGYTFTGWSPSVTATAVPTANATYTAQWRANTYNVTYSPNGGEGGGTGTVTFDTAYSGGTPTRTGYTFQGWSTTPTGGAASKCATAKDHTVYAVWEGISCTVTFHSNGTDMSTKTVTPGQPYGSLPKPTDGPAGTSFMGWMVDGKVVGQNTIVTKTSAHTLTARWEGTHTHGVDGGTGSTEYTGLSSQNFENAKKNRTDPTTRMTYNSIMGGYTLPSGNYYLVGDIKLDAPLTISGGNLCFNGATITLENNTRSYIKQGGNVLNICDCSGGGGVTSNDYFCFLSAATRDTYIATLYGGTFTSMGGEYCVNQNNNVNTLIIDGATIINNNTAANSYALHVYGKTTVKSGTISGYVGACTESSDASLTIEGGVITGTGSYGIENKYTTTVSGGTVTSTAGNGIRNTGTLTVSGGSVSSTAGSSAGIYNAGTATISGGDVRGTSSGIYNYAPGSLTVNGGTVFGSGEYGVHNLETFTLGGSPVIDGAKGGICVNDPITTVQSDLTGTFSVIPRDYDIGTSPVPVTAEGSGNYAKNFTAAQDGYGVRYNGSAVELYVTHKHLACGGAADTACTHSGNAHATVEFNVTTGGNLNTGSYYMTAEAGAVTIPSGATVSLCLNGHSASGINVQGTLNLCNCQSSGSAAVTIDGGTLNQYGVTANVTHNTGTWSFYSGTLDGSGAVTLGGELYLLDKPNMNNRTINLPKGKVVHLGSGLKAGPYKIAYTGSLTPSDPQVTLTDGWSTLAGSPSLGSYFTVAGPGKATAEVIGGEVVLRLPKITVNGQTYYLTSSGTLPSLPPTPAKPAADKIWDGWYTTTSGGTKVTTSTVLTDGATLHPRWTNCTHSNNDVTTVPATCTTAGSTRTVCETCGYTTEETIDKLAHTYGDAWHKDEANHWHECAVCGFRDQTDPHTWGSPSESGGERVYTCTTCQATKSEPIPKYTVTYEKDQYTSGDVPTQEATKEGGTFTLGAGSSLTRAGFEFGGWLELDEKGQTTKTTYTAGQTFTMPDHNVRFRVVWNQKDNYAPQPGEKVVLPDGTTIENKDGKVTIDQDGTGQAVTTIDPGSGEVTIQTGDPGQKPTVTLPAGSTVQTGNGPTVTIGSGSGAVDPAGTVDAPVGSTVTDSEGNKVEITGENAGKIDPEGSVTFPDGTDGKVTVTPEGGTPQDVEVPGGSEGVDSSGETPLPSTPTVILPEGGETLKLDKDGGSEKIQAEVHPEGTTLTWESSDPNVVTVSGDGTVTPVGPGDATITITPAGGTAVTVSVHVHKWPEAWTGDASGHWHVCACGTASAIEAHVYDNGDDTNCNNCGYERNALEPHPGPGTGDGYTIHYADETITVQSGYEVSTKNDGTGASVTTGTKLDPGTTLYIRKSADVGAGASQWVELPIPGRPAAPEGVAAVGETVTGNHDGKLTGLKPETGYQISKDGGQSWTDATVTEEGTITGLAPGDYQVRTKATDDAFAGEAAAAVTIGEGAAHTYTLTVTVPEFPDKYEDYGRPEAKAIIIENLGNSSVVITDVSVDDTNAFTIGGSGDTVPVGGSIDTWTIQPNAGLAVGSHIATVTVTHDGTTDKADVSFTVNAFDHVWTWTITADPTMNAPGQAARSCPGDEQHGKHSETEVEIPELSETTVWKEDRAKRVAPTETEPGSKTYTSKYGDVTVTVPATGHILKKVNGQVPTCTVDGWEDYYRCTGCGALFSDAGGATPIAGLAAWRTGDGKRLAGHMWDINWENNKLYHWHACSVCGGKKDYVVHAYTDDQDAFCDICGYARPLPQTAPSGNEGYAIDFGRETITITDGYEVSTKGDGTGDSVTDGKVTPGATLYIRKSADDTHAASDWTPLPIPARPAAPTVQGVNETVAGNNDGKITGLTGGTDYQFSKDGGDWENATVVNGEITDLVPGTYEVRVKATDDAFTSQTATVTIATGDAKTYTLNVEAPAFDAVLEGYERPEAKPITIRNSGNSDAAITAVTVSDTDKFSVGGEGETVTVGGSINTWTIQPAAGLAVGTHTAAVTVTYNDGDTATAEVSFTVKALTHAWTWTITNEPTMDAPGQATRVCKGEGDPNHEEHRETEVEIPALSDTTVWTEDETKRGDPTDTTDSSRTFISEYGTVTVSVPKLPYAAPNQGEGYAIDFDQAIITVEGGYEVNTKADGTGTAVNTGDPVTPGATLYIRKRGDAAHTASAWTPLPIPAQPDAPRVKVAGETAVGKNDGKITGLTAGTNYQISSDGKNWTDADVTDRAITGLAPGAYQVRAKATPSAFASKAAEVAVPAKTQCAVVFDSQGGSNTGAQTVAVGGKASQPGDPSKSGYIFNGWYTEPTCVHCWSFENTLTGDLILYAKWVEKTYSISGKVTKDGGNVSGIEVKLMQGNRQIGETLTTGNDGTYAFSGAAPGSYNVVATEGVEIMTILVTIENNDATEKNLTMPSGTVNSVLEIKGEDTPEVVVGELEKEAEAVKENNSSADSVTVTMTVESKDEDDAANAEEIKNKADVGTTLDFMEIKVVKKVNDTTTTMTSTNELLTIIIPFDSTGKGDVKVYRYHGKNVDTLTKQHNNEDEYIEVNVDRITLHVKKFSTYAIGSTGTAYAVTVQNDGHGTATADPAAAAEGATVTLTATPSSGYQFKEWQVISGVDVTISGNTFTMPAGSVAVKAVFEPVSIGPSGGDPSGSDPSGGDPSDDDPSGGDSSDDDSSARSYPPDIEQPEHGTIKVSPSRPERGDRVTVTVTPEKGYEVDEVTVTDKNGKAVAVTENPDGTYTFTQPAGNVTIAADLRPLQSSGGWAGCPKDSTCPLHAFPDVQTAAWYHNGVHYCVEKGLMSGYDDGKFGPSDNLSRAMLAQILYSQAGKPGVTGGSAFEDVASDAWYAGAIAWAASKGIVSGYGGGLFGPNDNITREQLAVMLYRLEQARGGGFKGNWMFLPDFTDREEISEWAYEAMCWMTMNGVISGKGNKILDPKGLATRAEAAAMLQQYLENAAHG